MKWLKINFLYVLLAVTVLLLSGCFNKHPDDSQIPWARPASWENSGPGGFGFGSGAGGAGF